MSPEQRLIAIRNHSGGLSFLDDYCGIPFVKHGLRKEGCDCWGLVRIVYAELFGISLPSFQRVPDRAESEFDAIRGDMPNWIQVLSGQERFADLVLLRVWARPHIGLITEPGKMLHVEQHAESAVVDYNGPRFANRILGFYRHPECPTI